MTRPRRLPVAVAALLLAPVLAGCGSDFGSGGGDGYVTVDGVITQLKETEREKPREVVAGETLQGDRVSLDDYAGKVVVVNVWGSWCPPCRKEADDLSLAARELAPQGVVFLGINTRDPSRENALAFERSRNVPYRSIYDPGGKNLLAFRGTLTPNSIPSTIIIDADGRVAASILGELTSARTLIGLVEDVTG